MDEIKPFPIKIAFLDVGQGDTIIVSSPETNEAIVVDCVNADQVLEYLENESIKYLRGIILTHLHSDHASGAIELLDNYRQIPNLHCDQILAYNPYWGVSNPSIKDYLKRDEDGHSDEYDELVHKYQRKSLHEDFKKWTQENYSKYKFIYVDCAPPFSGELSKQIEVLHPFSIDLSYLASANNRSVVLKVGNTHTSALLMGDIESTIWEQIQTKQGARLKSNVLKFPHHGAWVNSDAKTFLDVIAPSIVVVSVGTEGEKYKHPNRHIFPALVQKQIQILCTQATVLCDAQIRMKRSAIEKLFQKNYLDDDIKPVSSHNGCSCAGTVIVQLDDEVHILKPDLDFHRNQIIKQHFESPQCLPKN